MAQQQQQLVPEATADYHDYERSVLDLETLTCSLCEQIIHTDVHHSSPHAAKVLILRSPPGQPTETVYRHLNCELRLLQQRLDPLTQDGLVGLHNGDPLDTTFATKLLRCVTLCNDITAVRARHEALSRLYFLFEPPTDRVAWTHMPMTATMREPGDVSHLRRPFWMRADPFLTQLHVARLRWTRAAPPGLHLLMQRAVGQLKGVALRVPPNELCTPCVLWLALIQVSDRALDLLVLLGPSQALCEEANKHDGSLELHLDHAVVPQSDFRLELYQRRAKEITQKCDATARRVLGMTELQAVWREPKSAAMMLRATQKDAHVAEFYYNTCLHIRASGDERWYTVQIPASREEQREAEEEKHKDTHADAQVRVWCWENNTRDYAKLDNVLLLPLVVDSTETPLVRFHTGSRRGAWQRVTRSVNTSVPVHDRKLYCERQQLQCSEVESKKMVGWLNL